MRLDRTQGSHWIFILDCPFVLSIQKLKDGKAKPYQVRELLNIVEENGLDYSEWSMLKYSISIRWSDEDGGFIAISPELPGLSAFGKNQSKALAELKVAAQAYLRALRKSGNPMPTEDKVVSHSGQLRLRMPKSLHSELAESARNETVSLNTYLVSLLSRRQAERATAMRIVERPGRYGRRRQI
jgi:predicted RNase H-like HicB family nuclease